MARLALTCANHGFLFTKFLPKLQLRLLHIGTGTIAISYFPWHCFTIGVPTAYISFTHSNSADCLSFGIPKTPMAFSHALIPSCC